MARSEHLVSAAWLAEHLDDPDLVIADVRWYLGDRDGRREYLAGHIPGAHFVDLDRELSGAGPGRHPLPAADVFAALLGRLGVTRASTLVACDDMSGAIAARLWWLLRYFGLPIGRVLDGGLAAWNGERQTALPAARPAEVLALVAHPEMVVDADEVAAGVGWLIDARARERYRGDVEPIDARAGHIPGAHSVPWADNLHDGAMASDAVLRARFEAGQGRPIAAYCGSGVTACHDLLALAIAGRPDAKLYVGSWSDWSSDRTRPLATGDEPG
jgi:thiosulfate/3-mercaptopyruvate sulfurtransferase